jgi:arylsulfatase A-like enzyme
VGGLLTAIDDLGLRENTVVAITADHGEYLGEHGYFSHHELYQEVLHVPMMIRWPALKTGYRRKDQVSTVDLAPTLLKLIHQPPLEGAAGRDLFSPGAAKQNIPAFAEWRDYYLLKEYEKPVEDRFFLLSALKGGKKLIRSIAVPGREWLFNLKDDPEEENNLAGKDAPLKKQMDAVLDTHIQKDLENGIALPGNTQMDDETVKMLKNLGYLE